MLAVMLFFWQLYKQCVSKVWKIYAALRRFTLSHLIPSHHSTCQNFPVHQVVWIFPAGKMPQFQAVPSPNKSVKYDDVLYQTICLILSDSQSINVPKQLIVHVSVAVLPKKKWVFSTKLQAAYCAQEMLRSWCWRWAQSWNNVMCCTPKSRRLEVWTCQNYWISLN